MKGARALAGGMLVLAASCAVPAISAAQDAGTTTDATTTTTPAPAPPTPPADPGGEAGPSTPEASPTGPAAGTPGEAPDQSRTTDTSLADSPPADGPGGGAHKAASASVTIADFFFSPASVTVAIGDTVTWHNTGQAPHNATANDGSFKTPDLNQGRSASHRFTSAGTFSYICTIHPNMHGTVRVLSSSGGGGGSGGSAGANSSGSATSESSAVASPEAAGDANTLPATGMAVGGLAVVGLALLGLGLIARQADRQRSGRRWPPIF
ncbi:MAG TPA: cupredoxin family copper-binding protein [Solirubrobacterales bacterium]